MRSDPICLRVKGPFACFTRPEFHVERVSYPVITPSAARGILEAILMKPIEKPEAGKRHNKVGFRWLVTRIGVVNKGTMFSILRNELGYATHQKPERAIGYDVNDCRAQRHSLILKDVEYLIEARLKVEDGLGACGIRGREHLWNSVQVVAKYHQMFLRRAKAGQCFYQPFFGCREFSVAEWEIELNPPQSIESPAANENFGIMFQDFDFEPMWSYWSEGNRPATGWKKHEHRPRPTHFQAQAIDGWITVNQEEKT